MLSYFTILKHHFIIIPYHFITPTSQNSIFIKILFFNHSLLFISNRYIFSDGWKLLHFFHLFFTLSPMLSISFSLYFFQIVGTSSFFSSFFHFLSHALCHFLAIFFQIVGTSSFFSLSLCPSISLSLCLTASQVCGSLWC